MNRREFLATSAAMTGVTSMVGATPNALHPLVRHFEKQQLIEFPANPPVLSGEGLSDFIRGLKVNKILCETDGMNPFHEIRATTNLHATRTRVAKANHAMVDGDRIIFWCAPSSPEYPSPFPPVWYQGANRFSLHPVHEENHRSLSDMFTVALAESPEDATARLALFAAVDADFGTRNFQVVGV